MDLISESTSGGRVLIARHVGPEKASLDDTDAINTTALCNSPDLPDVCSYIAGLQFYGTVLWACGAIALLATIALFCVTLKTSIRHRPTLVTQTVFILAVYPVVAILSFVAMVVPRARLISEALAQQTVMLAMFQLFLFIIGDCGGSEQLVRRAEGAKLETRVLPCCCWPCCVIPRPLLHKKRLFTLRLLVLQMPIVQAILYVIILMLWAEDPWLYHNNFIYLQPVIATSILFGVWGIVMCVRAAESAGLKPRGKFLALQLVLLIVKVQGGTVNFLPKLFYLPCHPPLTPTVYVNLVHNGLVVLEMLLLSIWAWRLYSVPPSKMSDRIHQVKVVAVLEDSSTPVSLDGRIKDGVENKCFAGEIRDGSVHKGL